MDKSGTKTANPEEIYGAEADGADELGTSIVDLAEANKTKKLNTGPADPADLTEADRADKSDIGLANPADPAEVNRIDKLGTSIADRAEANEVNKSDTDLAVKDSRKQPADR